MRGSDKAPAESTRFLTCSVWTVLVITAPHPMLKSHFTTFPICWGMLLTAQIAGLHTAVCLHCLPILIYLLSWAMTVKQNKQLFYQQASDPREALCYHFSSNKYSMKGRVVTAWDFWTVPTQEKCTGHLWSLSICWYAAHFTGSLAEGCGIFPKASTIHSFFHYSILEKVTLSRLPLTEA